MTLISNIGGFRAALEASKPVVLKRDGTWYVQNRVSYFVRWLFGFERQRLLNIGRIVNESFYQIEKNKTCEGVDVENWIKVNECVDKTLAHAWRNNSVIECRDLLLRHRIALSIRAEKTDLLKEVQEPVSRISETKAKIIVVATLAFVGVAAFASYALQVSLLITMGGAAVAAAALAYYLVRSHGTKKTETEKTDSKTELSDKDKLLKLAAEWKAKELNLKSIALTEDDEKHLGDIFNPSFKSFLKILLNNRRIREHAFKVILRSKIDAAPLMLFPGHVNKIDKCFMEMRLADKRPNRCPLKVQAEKVNGKWEFDLTLPFYTSNKKVEHISILDDKAKVELRGCFGEKIEKNHGNRTYTIDQIFQVFKEKNLRVGNLELLHFVGGNLEPAVVMYDSHLHGYVDGEGKTHQIDANDPEFYLQFPLADLMTMKEAKENFEAPFVWVDWKEETGKRFGKIPGLTDWIDGFEFFKTSEEVWNEFKEKAAIKFKDHPQQADLQNWFAECQMYYRKVDGKRWIEYGAATRKDNGLGMLGTHALRGWGIPFEFKGETYYAIRDKGKYSAGDFPISPKEFLEFFEAVLNAEEESPDTNNNYLNRYLTLYSILLQNPDITKQGLERWRKKILLSREGKSCFQYQANGCGKDVQDEINIQRELAGLRPLNPFYIKNKKTRPTGIIGFLHTFAKPFPTFVQKSILYALGAYKKKRVIVDGEEREFSYYGSKAWNDQRFHLPAALHERQIKEVQRETKKYPLSFLPKKLPPFLQEAAKVKVVKKPEKTSFLTAIFRRFSASAA